MAECSTSSDVKDVSDENSMTLVDFLEEEMQLESDADAVLGPSDDKNCTYSRGYLQRQALYACMTCTPPNISSAEPAGICLACSYHCHEDHELVELYTKRFFRCDCGNSRFSGKKCNLEPNKTEDNEKNVYNQNFRGLYCVCSRPYPDPEDDTPDEMLQCIICEDWYHTRHLKNQVPPETNYAELICGSCTDKLPFLNHYLGLSVSTTLKDEMNESKEEVDVVKGVTEGTSSSVNVLLDHNAKEDKTNENETELKIENTLNVDGNRSFEEEKESLKDEITEPNECGASSEVNGKGPSSDPGVCKLLSSKQLDRPDQSATLWPSNFRSLLCRCSTCLDLYTTLNVPWIVDENDTVQSYEAIAEGTRKNSQYEAGLEALATLDRVSQVEAIQNYNDLKTNLSDFLIKFVKQKRVVKKEDIDEFFTDMQAKKRQKTGTPPYSCH